MKTERNNKHFVIYYHFGVGTYVVTEPRPWARENRGYFPNHDFNSDWAPRTEEINKVLIDDLHFDRRDYDDQNITVLFNLNPNLEI